MPGSCHPGFAGARGSPRLCWHWCSGLSCPSGRSSPAGCRVPCAGDRHATSRGRSSPAGGVSGSSGHSWGILRAPASPLETPSSWTPLVKIAERGCCPSLSSGQGRVFYCRSHWDSDEVRNGQCAQPAQTHGSWHSSLDSPPEARDCFEAQRNSVKGKLQQARCEWARITLSFSLVSCKEPTRVLHHDLVDVLV
jgi:hypothetical protein